MAASAAAVIFPPGDGDTMETWLYKATNPLSTAEDWESIVGFCDTVNKDLEGPQTAVRLLVHKIQSPNEKESLLALTTLEACVKNCGRRFQQEIGKFRFINEIIKVVSPKYLGNHMSEKVKRRCTELLFNWSQVLAHEPKIKEAYQMLRRQGIIKQDPVQVETLPLPPSPPPRPKNSIFEEEEKSKLLARLLRSKNPDDLQAANRLIKNMVKQDADRMEKVSKRTQQLDTTNNNVKLLSDMLQNHEPGGATESDKEIMKELYDNLETQRPSLFRLASDTDERDSLGITEILKANDEVIKVMSLYEQIINKSGTGDLLPTNAASREGKKSFLTDLECLQSPTSISSVTALGGGGGGSILHTSASTSSSLLDDQLLSLGLDFGYASNGTGDVQSTQGQVDDLTDLFLSAPVASAGVTQAASSGVASHRTTSTPMSTTFLSASNTLMDTSVFSSSTAIQNQYSFPSSIDPSIRPPFTHHPIMGSSTLNTTNSTILSPASGVPVLQPLPLATGATPSSILLPTVAHVSKPVAASTVGSKTVEPVRPAASSTVNWFSNESNSSSVSVKAPQLQQHALGFESIDEIGKTLLQQNLTTTSDWKQFRSSEPAPKLSLNQLSKGVGAGPTPGVSASSSDVISIDSTNLLSSTSSSSSLKEQQSSSVNGSPIKDSRSLADVNVSLETIQPGSISPVTVYDKNNIKITLHFGKDRPRSDVQVIVVSVMSTSSSPVKNFIFQAAVPKVLKVKLQPASSTDLPGYNPILPPAAITQVMLVAHPPEEKVRLKFKITYTINDGDMTDVGELDGLPLV